MITTTDGRPTSPARFRRRLSHLARVVVIAATSVSALLCAATLALWPHSHHTAYALAHSTPGGWYYRVIVDSGAVRWETAPVCPLTTRGLSLMQSPAPAATRGRYAYPLRASDGTSWDGAVIADVHGGLATRVASIGGPRTTHAHGQCPLWAVALTTALLPVALLARSIHTKLNAGRRARAGLCPNCGYDLRATPARCPECGAAPIPLRQPNPS